MPDISEKNFETTIESLPQCTLRAAPLVQLPEMAGDMISSTWQARLVES